MRSAFWIRLAAVLTSVSVLLSPGYFRHAFVTNTALMCAGFLLFGYQLSGYALGS